MSFVITNNVRYYDLTFISALAKAIKCQLQSFSSSLPFFSLRFMAIISFSLRIKEDGIEGKFPQ